MDLVDRILKGESINDVLETTTVSSISPTVSQMPGHKQYTTKPIHRLKKRKGRIKNERNSRSTETKNDAADGRG